MFLNDTLNTNQEDDVGPDMSTDITGDITGDTPDPDPTVTHDNGHLTDDELTIPNLGKNGHVAHKLTHDSGHVSPDSPDTPNTPNTPDDTTQLVLRALVSTKEAGVIIGKDGATVAGLRDAAKVKAGVTKSVAGIPDRILSVAGTATGVSRAIGLAAAALVAHPPSG